MALEAVFRELSTSLNKLHDALNALQRTLGDTPPGKESALVDDLENSVLEMIGMLHEARRAATKAGKAAATAPDLDRMRRPLAICHHRFQKFEQEFWSDLISYEKLRELDKLAVARGREWTHWANSTEQGIEQCGKPMRESSHALARCWEEIVDHFVTRLWIAEKMPRKNRRR